MVFEYIEKVKTNGYFEERRNRQQKYWMYESIEDRLKQRFYSLDGMKSLLEVCEQQLLQGKMTSFAAASKALGYFDKTNGCGSGNER